MKLLKTRIFNSGNVLLYYKQYRNMHHPANMKEEIMNRNFLSQEEVKAMIKLSTPSNFQSVKKYSIRAKLK